MRLAPLEATPVKKVVTATLATIVNDEIAEVGTLSLLAPNTPVPHGDLAEEGWDTVAFLKYAEDTVEHDILTGTFVSAVECNGKIEATFEVGSLGGVPLYIVVDPAWIAYRISVISDDLAKYQTLNT